MSRLPRLAIGTVQVGAEASLLADDETGVALMPVFDGPIAGDLHLHDARGHPSDKGLDRRAQLLERAERGIGPGLC